MRRRKTAKSHTPRPRLRPCPSGAGPRESNLTMQAKIKARDTSATSCISLHTRPELLAAGPRWRESCGSTAENGAPLSPHCKMISCVPPYPGRRFASFGGHQPSFLAWYCGWVSWELPLLFAIGNIGPFVSSLVFTGELRTGSPCLHRGPFRRKENLKKKRKENTAEPPSLSKAPLNGSSFRPLLPRDRDLTWEIFPLVRITQRGVSQHI